MAKRNSHSFIIDGCSENIYDFLRKRVNCVTRTHAKKSDISSVIQEAKMSQAYIVTTNENFLGLYERIIFIDSGNCGSPKKIFEKISKSTGEDTYPKGADCQKPKRPVISDSRRSAPFYGSW